MFSGLGMFLPGCSLNSPFLCETKSTFCCRFRFSGILMFDKGLACKEEGCG